MVIVVELSYEQYIVIPICLPAEWWEQGFLRDHSPEVLRGDADSGGNLFPFSPEDEPARETHMLIK